MKKLTDDILSIVYRLVDLQEEGSRDNDSALSELTQLKEKLEAIGQQIDFEQEGYFSREHDIEAEIQQHEKFSKLNDLYSRTMEKIKKMQVEFSGFNRDRFIRGMFPNEEDYQDYLDGEF